MRLIPYRISLATATCTLTTVLVAVLFTACGNKPAQQGMANEFSVRTLQGQTATFNNTYPAVIEGRNDADIRPKISGFITRVAVQEGSKVRKGQVLFTLDDATQRAAVGQATAAVTAARASLSTAQLNYDNSVQLKQKNVISETGLTTATNTLANAKATLASAQAALASARDNLSYCTVTSPSNGIVGVINYRVGNLVNPSIAKPLTQVSDIDVMYVYFSISEQESLQMVGNVSAFPAVHLKLADGSLYAQKGAVVAMSGIIDRATGSISVRADFPNPMHKLRSGGSGSVLVPYDYKNAILIPQTATVEILNKKYVYVLGADNKVIYTPIEIATVDDGQNYVVLQGLKIGDRIVLEGLNALKDGMQIIPITEQEAAKKQAAMQQQMMKKAHNNQ